MTTIKGVDRSVQSLPCPTVEVNGVVVDNATVTFNEAVPSPTTTLTPDKFVPTVMYTVEHVVTPALAKLLAKILSTTDASIPNKDQNRAVKRIIRDEFDETYFRVLRGAFPDCQVGQSAGSYALEPEPDKKPTVIL